MLTQLTTVKSRLALPELEPQYDTLLTNAIKAVSERFDKECRRTLARTENFQQEFAADATELCAACYPIESVSKFELKTDEADGWREQVDTKFLVRCRCVISLAAPLSAFAATQALGRVTYSGGFVLPGAAAGAGQSPLPADLEQAAVEQIAFWFQNRDRLGLVRLWEYHGTYRQFGDLDLLQTVKAVLFQYTRWEF